VQLKDQALDTVDLAKTDPVNYNAYRLIAEKYQWASSKFYPKMFGDNRQPQTLHQTLVQGDVQLVCDQATRQAMIEARNRFLKSTECHQEKLTDGRTTD
jgi:hypothetical protein